MLLFCHLSFRFPMYPIESAARVVAKLFNTFCRSGDDGARLQWAEHPLSRMKGQSNWSYDSSVNLFPSLLLLQAPLSRVYVMDWDECHNHFCIWWFGRTPVLWKWTRWQITSCKLKPSKRASFRLHRSNSWLLFSGFFKMVQIILIIFHISFSFYQSVNVGLS